VHLAVSEAARYSEWLDRVECGTGRVHLAGTLIEDDDEVVEFVLWGRQLLPR
jgi:hypothetical protein